MSKITAGLVAICLLLALGMQVLVPTFSPSIRAVKLSVAEVLPVELPPWIVQNHPIAENEFLASRVSDILQFDEAVMRSYRRGSTEILIYVAYWRPEKAPYSVVGSHTPDTCWVHNGWTRETRHSGQSFAWGNNRLQPAETGIFSYAGRPTHVAFWHLVGGRPITYDQHGWDGSWRGKLGRAIQHIRDWRRFGLAQRDDQCFVRISSNRPLAELVQEPAVQALLDRLRPLGLLAP